MSSISSIKSKLGIETLKLAYSTDADGTVDTNWFRHWENSSRIAVSIPADVVEKIKADPKLENLHVQHEVRTGSKGKYESYRIVMHEEANIIERL